MSFSGTKGYITKPEPGVMLNPLHPLSQGLVGYWLFNEGAGSRVYDISGYRNHGTLKNMLPNTQNSGWGGSKFGGGLDFDGGNDYVSINGLIKTLANNIQGSVGFRVKLATDNDAENIPFSLSRDADGTRTEFFVDFDMRVGHNHITMFLQTDGTLQWDWRGNVDSLDSYVGNWAHVEIIHNGTSPVLYIDGQNYMGQGAWIDETDKTKWMKAILTDATSKADTANIGLIKINGVDHVPFNGSVDFGYINNCTHTTWEANQLYQDPFCNLLQVPIRRYSVAAPPVGAIINQFQTVNLGADLYNGVLA